jgi:hypothetical protein
MKIICVCLFHPVWQTSAAGTPTLFTGAVPGTQPFTCTSDQQQQSGGTAREAGPSGPPAAAGAPVPAGGQVSGSGQYIPAMTSQALAIRMGKGTAASIPLLAMAAMMLR